jgi:gluconate 5-dehydrogenase
LGLAIGTGLAEAGARLILCDIDEGAVEQRRKELEGRGLKVAACNFDVTNEDQVSAAVERIEGEIGPLDILVNNAGINLRMPLEETPQEKWRAVIDLNLNAVWLVSKHAVRGMIQRRRGKIINIASLLTFAARPTIGAYTASKTAVAGLTRAMTVEWAKHNVQINAIAPGYFLTEMTRPLAENPELNNWVMMRTPAGRWGKPEELVGLAIFYASAASDFVTGQVVYVDGGWTANL